MADVTPRIVSLLPSATEIAVAVGVGDALVGRSHECDYPTWVERLPVCTATKLEKGLTSRQIDDRVREIVRQGLSMYEVDTELLRSLEPDLILTQSQCAVCAVTPADLEEALARWTGHAPAIVSLAPERLGDVGDDMLRVGRAAGVENAGERARDAFRSALDDVGRRVNSIAGRPTVAAIEWVDPLMAAGNWIPELIALAGGEALLAEAGQHSPALDFGQLAAADPDAIVLMPCGYRIDQVFGDARMILGDSRWQGLRAVSEDMLFAVDGHHFFNRPGPRLVESAVIVAELLAAPAAVRLGHGGAWARVP